MWIILLAAAMAFVFMLYRKKRGRKEKKVFQQYSSKEGDFVISGRKDNFRIKKDANIEFLVKDGQIVASRDLRVGKDFVYYGGTADGTFQ